MTSARPRAIVELGTENGVSYSAFCEAVIRTRCDARAYAIDLWKAIDKLDFMPKAFSSIGLMWQITAPLRTVEARLPARLQIALRRRATLGWCWAQSADLALLASSQMFAADWYVRNYPDVPAAGIDPAAHYLGSGAAEGRDPSPHFSTAGYLDRYPDVAATGTNPLLHYLQHGADEGRKITSPTDLELIAKSELFDREWYLKKYSDVIEAGIDPATHYLSDGAVEKRDPGPRFCTEAYLQRYPDVAAGEMNPLLHYILHGMKEGRDISPVVAYLKSYPDVAAFYS